MKQKFDNEDTLFQECVIALQDNVKILSESETHRMWLEFKKNIPLIPHSARVDWTKIEKKFCTEDLYQVMPNMTNLLKRKFNTSVYVFWNDASVPVILTDLNLILENFDDVISVGFETWLYSPSEGYIIEHNHSGYLNGGLLI